MLHEEERKISAKIYFRAGICHHSDFVHVQVFQQYQIVDRLDPNTRRIKITFIRIAYFY